MKMTISSKTANEILRNLIDKWSILHRTPKIFAYQLNITKSKCLPNEKQKHLSFYCELNKERTELRRPPQTIYSLFPVFDETKFNFNKIKAQEVIAVIPYKTAGGQSISFIVNNSPLTLFHTLICPDVTNNLPQRINLAGLSFCVNFLLPLWEEQPVRVGYNSPGALASVNHLHFHLMYLDMELYIDKADLEPLSDNHIFRLTAQMPTEAICFMFYHSDTEIQIKAKVIELYDLIHWLCEQNIPHNVFMTQNRQKHALNVFVFARENYCIAKEAKGFNIGFCELSGFVPVGDEKLYDCLTAQNVITKIKNETGNIYGSIYNYLTELE